MAILSKVGAYLRRRWGLTTGWQITRVFIVFGLTGTTTARLVKLAANYLHYSWSDTPFLMLLLWLLGLVLYHFILLGYGWLFGMFPFFRNFVAKITKRFTRS